MQTYLITKFVLTEQDHDDIQNAICVLSDIVTGLNKAGTNSEEIELFSKVNEYLVKLNETGTID